MAQLHHKYLDKAYKEFCIWEDIAWRSFRPQNVWLQTSASQRHTPPTNLTSRFKYLHLITKNPTKSKYLDIPSLQVIRLQPTMPEKCLTAARSYACKHTSTSTSTSRSLPKTLSPSSASSFTHLFFAPLTAFVVKVILAGASGFIGTELLSHLLSSTSITSIIILSRRPLADIAARDPRIRVFVLKSFLEFEEEVRGELEGARAVFW
ncbi:uncharacterized protein LY89DRAFT_469857 [Mollisia scopiformis]|uniref:Thioester reductase (TE) domain-containing protein n=1 Tax=Mollisia scopiformis TaxID=149040 RepID=A0A194XIU2_MOLSC|nr:uncharacterized protein LY89DRAFT_469857 [Mollisia scopiformis]KUJ20051.1 hypothetical protein LY89DRAFT_469857 [Mollisia scopiformis]